MFTGLSAFPLTPVSDRGIDEEAFAGLVTRLATARVDSITALGSTGSYPYLDRAERARAARLAVEHAGSTPVIVGIGALRTRDVLELAEDAQEAGASGVLLAPVSYQALTADEVFGLYEDVTASLSVPLVVYDNPGTTHFTFTDELYARIAELPHVASIKIPGVQAAAAEQRLAALRALLPPSVTIGVSGDPLAATGLNAGSQAWYSVIAGTLPEPALAITRAAQAGDAATAAAESERLQPLWDLFSRLGSLRVVSAIAEVLGLVGHPNLPLPLRGLPDGERAAVADVVQRLDLR
ncbi:dihydrodipicolinate synthase family protein [Saccharopolyspora mangrovi]|uniref:Dihydrodipicolinate synthase family protein n=1 Tax=Saccharopolyspora mangrovi TaxID=3082379 RepID=A0ABU6ABQ1_9PSEU|nr:dihydrodipicolinate synthase family protein [Saccharopolyspora sp. S2-29]MEB3368897.1 dihydrodipicolinate synthase family protein [Saccharopolyspora sp. S2-29]